MVQQTYLKIVSKLNKRRNQAQIIFDNHINKRINVWEMRFLSESLISNIWQDWNVFVKQILIQSCNGITTRSGIVHLPRLLDNCEARITYEVNQYGKGNSVSATKVFSGAIEPTWAHPDRIVGCINGLAMSNVSELRLAFGSAGLVGPKRIHTVRNTCAHKSKITRAEVEKLRKSYITTHFLDPIDIIWATNPATNSIAIFEWIQDLEYISDLATQ